MIGTRALQSPEDHPKLIASSSAVKASCERIYHALGAKGLRLSQDVSRDGFLLRLDSRVKFWIHPKREALRIHVGYHPSLPSPKVLIHPGRQPDWIVVYPNDTDEAIVYMTNLVVAATNAQDASNISS